MSGRRILRRLLGTEGGYTLIEMSVVMTTLTVILGIVLVTFSAFERNATFDSYRLENLDEGRVIMATMTKDIRTATMLQAGTSPFIKATQVEMQFYANLNVTTGGPNLVRIYVDTTNPAAPELVEQTTPPDAGSAPNYTYCSPGTPPCATTKTRFVGKYVTNNTTTNPLFHYYDQDGNELTALPLSASDMLLVQSVSLSVRKSVTGYLPATTLVNRVRLPNVFFTLQDTPTP
jgi:hypothetical protein